MYGVKRGIRLSNNLVVVPSIEALAAQLPTLRSTTATATARSLQQASHKGLCALHRGIASIEKMDASAQREVLDKLAVVSQIAHRLAAYVGGVAAE